MIKVAFYGRVSTEDPQDPEASKGWQMRRAKQLIEPHGGVVVEEFFDVGMSRSLLWKRRHEATRLLAALANVDRGFDSVVIGEPQRAFYGNQFGLTFPVFTHYGVQLWVPEVGGPIDPGSEAHDMVMMLFGGMSKAERTRVQLRTKAAMQELAASTDRFLGGRPPYGYQLVDAGPHPNPGRAAPGQRADRLERDPLAAPVVVRIFRLYAEGQGLRSIAQRLTDDGQPSPAAHDPARNTHRDTRGWAHSAVRAILKNEAYTGLRVWAKQQKVESLVDPDDVAAGQQTRLRWRDERQWIRPDRRTHPQIVPDDLFNMVRGLLASDGSGDHKTRTSTHPYGLRGVLFCGHCGRRMQGAWRKNRADDSTGRILYRCTLRSTRSMVPQLSNHPKSLYVREDAILPHLDSWITSLVTPEVLAAGQDDLAQGAQAVSLRAKISELDRKIASLVAAVESGAEIAALTDQLSRRSAERAGLQAQLRGEQSAERLTVEEIRKALADLGGIAEILPKTPVSMRAKLYASLGVRLEYDHVLKCVRATAESACVPGRVRRGT
jgi:site-specific DNA recombinase